MSFMGGPRTQLRGMGGGPSPMPRPQRSPPGVIDAQRVTSPEQRCATPMRLVAVREGAFSGVRIAIAAGERGGIVSDRAANVISTSQLELSAQMPVIKSYGERGVVSIQKWILLAKRNKTLDGFLGKLRRSDEIRSLQEQISGLYDQIDTMRNSIEDLNVQVRTHDDIARHATGELVIAREQLDQIELRFGPIDRLTTIELSAARFLDFHPPGHFYSPVPSLVEIEERAEQIFAVRHDLPGITLSPEEQLGFLATLAPLARDLDLPKQQVSEWRYWLDNPNFGPGDASVFGAMLRHLRPRRYVEVGSGWSTALALDVNERWLNNETKIAAIEPHPAQLKDLIWEGDQIEIVGKHVQDIPIEYFTCLEDGDVLFIDGSHVVKVGSDTHYLITRVLPVLQPGVFVHIHDIFWPFEYPREWIEGGRAWNEAYLLHAFLLFNSAFRIELFNNWFTAVADPTTVSDELPALSTSSGGSFWMRRVV